MEAVDILVANWNTLPWLRLFVSRVEKHPPSVPFRLWLWDNASQDGSAEWIADSGYDHVLSPVRMEHAYSLSSLMEVSQSPVVALMDVDAVVLDDGWLDEAVALLRNGRIGAAGLRGGKKDAHHRHFVHPSFCVFRRTLFQALGTSLSIVKTGVSEQDLDVAESMCRAMENAEYMLEFTGDAPIDIQGLSQGKRLSKVLHLWASTTVLADGRNTEEWRHAMRHVVMGHRYVLGQLGLWNEFEKYLQEAAARNPLCERYFETS